MAFFLWITMFVDQFLQLSTLIYTQECLFQYLINAAQHYAPAIKHLQILY